MKRLLERLWPDRLLTQILVLLALSGLFMVALSTTMFSLLKERADRNPAIMHSHFISVAIGKLNETPVEQRHAVLKALREELPEIMFEFVGEDALAAYGGTTDGKRFGPFQTGETLLGMRIEHVVSPRERGGDQPPLVIIRLQDGALLAAEWGTRAPPPPAPAGPFLLFFGFVALSFCGLMIWAARGVSGPMADLAASASRFGEGSTRPVPVREHGPREVRAAAQAFNRMQLRINEFVEKRTRMLAAISHDLRTPLTRLRLRLDLLEDTDIRERSLKDLQLMEQQVDSALIFLRDGASSEPVQRIDVPSFLQSLTDQYEDTGQPVPLSFEGKLSVMVRGGELGRALSNLIDNANNYASGAEIRAYRVGDRVVIDVIDQGPGIVAEDRARLLEPFERGDAARRIREGTGFGLGLAIAKSIVEAAAGTLALLETEGGGLTVRLIFPSAGPKDPRPAA
ncbi:HAMP domain-containing sensor histidine kinase [Roseibium sp. M-1]